MKDFTKFMRFFREMKVHHLPSGEPNEETVKWEELDENDNYVQREVTYDQMISVSQSHFLFYRGEYVGVLADEMGDVSEPWESILSERWYND